MNSSGGLVERTEGWGDRGKVDCQGCVPSKSELEESEMRRKSNMPRQGGQGSIYGDGVPKEVLPDEVATDDTRDVTVRLPGEARQGQKVESRTCHSS